MTGMSGSRGTIAIVTLGLASCASSPERACERLTVGEQGVARADYLPCAAAMVEAMNTLDRLGETLAKGRDAATEQDANRELLRLQRMVKAVGGVKGLQQEWGDGVVSQFNRATADALGMYAVAFYGVGVPFNPIPGISAHNVQMAREAADPARAAYEQIRQDR